MAAQESKESKVVLERTYNVPLRREYMKAQMYRRAKRAVKGLRSFLERHMKSDNVKIGPHANRAIWKNGVRNPPHQLHVHAVKYDSGEVYGELVGAPAQESAEPAQAKSEKGKQQATAEQQEAAAEAPAEQAAAEEESSGEESSEEQAATEETTEEGASGEEPEEEPTEQPSGEEAAEEAPEGEEPAEGQSSGEESSEEEKQ